MISSLRYWIFGDNFCPLDGRKNIFLSASRSQFVLTRHTKILKIGQQIDKVLWPKKNFEKGFSIVKNHGREVIIFPQNFKTHGILL